MKDTRFINDDFLLTTANAKRLYKEFAEHLPIVDFHNHLSPFDIATNRKFENITQLWIDGDHYKWRAMRANGVDEKYCTGNASDKDKFIAWASTVPATLRNPLFHWSHLELARYFGIYDLLTKENAEFVYDKCNEMLQSEEFRVRGLLTKMNVELVCTTDDPTDTLEYHVAYSKAPASFKVLPTFRPDKAFDVSDAKQFIDWVAKLEASVGFKISSYADFKQAIRDRHDFFANAGGCIADIGLSQLPKYNSVERTVEEIFESVVSGNNVSQEVAAVFSLSVLELVMQLNHSKNWVQQFHIGAIRNNLSSIYTSLGPDKGFDSIGDFSHMERMSKLFDLLDSKGALAKTIVYNLNAADNDSFAAMAANYNDGSSKGKMQYGAGWWFLDQKNGIVNQLNTVSNYGLLGNFVGMVTDSRSFLSFPRHEYFRRILCDVLGKEMESGELPNDIQLIGALVTSICYTNAKNYLNQ